MGCCCSTAEGSPPLMGATGQPTQPNVPDRVHMSLSKPLVPVTDKCETEQPWTKERLEKERREFWETMPSYGGQEKVWIVMRDACNIFASDMNAAQKMLVDAGIITPNGRIVDSYDQLGYNYVIPLYCIKEPSNLVTGEQKNQVKTDIPLEDNSVKTVKIRLSSGKDLETNVKSTTTIADLKAQIASNQGIEAKRVLILKGGKLLPDEVILTSLKLEAKDMLQGMIRPQ